MKNKKVIFVKLMGGLGNQLFQVAKALDLSISERYELIIQISGNLKQSTHEEIEKRLANASFTTCYEEFSKVTNLFSGLLLRARGCPGFLFLLLDASINAIQSVRYALGFSKYSSFKIVSDLGYSEIGELREATLLVGYFQTYKNVEKDCVYLAMERFLNPTESTAVKKYTKMGSVMNPLIIHVRLGDYIQEEKFGILDVDYYHRAIGNIFARSQFDHIWIFSDDLEMCKMRLSSMLENLSVIYKFDTLWISENELNDWETWQIMRLGSGYIIANSSFSWWAAMMRKKYKAHIIAPNPWFSEIKEPTELIPKEWIRIPRGSS